VAPAAASSEARRLAALHMELRETQSHCGLNRNECLPASRSGHLPPALAARSVPQSHLRSLAANKSDMLRFERISGA
jgi:hypothetical protein